MPQDASSPKSNTPRTPAQAKKVVGMIEEMTAHLNAHAQRANKEGQSHYAAFRDIKHALYAMLPHHLANGLVRAAVLKSDWGQGRV